MTRCGNKKALAAGATRALFFSNSFGGALAPEAGGEFEAIAAVFPAGFYPDRGGPGRMFPVSADPDPALAVAGPVAIDPDVTGAGGSDDDFTMGRRGCLADVYNGLGRGLADDNDLAGRGRIIDVDGAAKRDVIARVAIAADQEGGGERGSGEERGFCGEMFHLDPRVSGEWILVHGLDN